MKKRVIDILLCITVIIALTANFFLEEYKIIGVVCWVIMIILGFLREKIVHKNSKK